MKISKDNISGISNRLLAGRVAIMPSDTVYGFFACALNSASVERIYSIKKRDLNKPFIILISDISDLNSFGVDLSDYQSKFLNKYWPGPISVVFDCPNEKFKYLHRGSNSLAFRIPKDDWLLEILSKTGPLVAPSANLQGTPTVKNIDDATKIFSNIVDFYVDGGICEGSPSTIVKLNQDNLVILRSGKFIVHASL